MRFAWILILLTVLSGCASTILKMDAVVNPRAKCVLVKHSFDETAYGAIRVTLTIKNVGRRPASHVSCTLKAKHIISKVIVDTAFTSFAPGCYIWPGEQVEGKAIFFELESLREVMLTHSLDWLDR